MENVDPSSFPIKVKVVYAKMLFLIDSRKFKDRPVFYRILRGSNKKEPVYDSAMYYVFTEFNIKNKDRGEFKFTANPGTVQEAVPVHPSTTEEPYPYLENIPQFYELSVRLSTHNTAIVVAYFYNSFQNEEQEWADAVALDNTKELKLWVDFSSIIAAPEKDDKEKLLFKRPPTAYLVDKNKNKKEIKKFDDIDTKKKIFMTSYNDVQKNQSLRIEWNMDWNNLATSQLYYDNPKNIPTKNDAFNEQRLFDPR